MRARSWIARKMRPSCTSANRVTSGLPLFPVTEVSGKTTRSQPAAAVSSIRRRCASRLRSTSVNRTSTCVAATRQRLISLQLRAVCVARDDDDVVALVGRRDRPHDADDPVRLALDRRRLAVGPLEEVDPADRLAGGDALAEVDEGLEQPGLGSEEVGVA